jgi:hypothetical protein
MVLTIFYCDLETPRVNTISIIENENIYVVETTPFLEMYIGHGVIWEMAHEELHNSKEGGTMRKNYDGKLGGTDDEDDEESHSLSIDDFLADKVHDEEYEEITKVEDETTNESLFKI